MTPKNIAMRKIIILSCVKGWIAPSLANSYTEILLGDRAFKKLIKWGH